MQCCRYNNFIVRSVQLKRRRNTISFHSFVSADQALTGAGKIESTYPRRHKMQSMCALLIDISQLSIETHVPRFVLSFPDTCTRSLFLDLEQTSLLLRRAGPSVLQDVCPVPCSRIGRAYLSSRCLLPLRRIVGSRCCIAGQFEHDGKTNEEDSERGREGKGI